MTTLREKLVKIGAKVIAYAQCSIFQVVEVAVSRDLFRRVLEIIGGVRPPGAVPC